MNKNLFTRFAQATAAITGNAWTFVTAVTIIIVWACLGPVFGFSNTWQLVVNTGTTIITFLMVFLIQNTQNRDTYALQLKLDELIRSNEKAHNALMDIEELDEKELCRIRDYYEDLAKKARKDPAENKKIDTDFPLEAMDGSKPRKKKTSSKKKKA